MKKLTKFLVSVFTGAMLLGMTAFASEYSVTPANAVFYTNGETVVLADAATDAQVILPGCEAGLPIQVTGVTSNGYWQIVLGDATYYVVGAGLSQTAESAAEVNTSTPAQPVTKSYHIVDKNGYPYVDTAVSSYQEAYEVAIAMGYPLYQVIDEGGSHVWCYGLRDHAPYDGDKDMTAEKIAAEQIYSILESRGYPTYKYRGLGEMYGKITFPDGDNNRVCYIPHVTAGSYSVTALGLTQLWE